MDLPLSKHVPIINPDHPISKLYDYSLGYGDVSDFLDQMDPDLKFDLVVTSPPYNLGKSYEEKTDLNYYLEWQSKIIQKIIPHVRDTGSICWNVGNYVENGAIWPLDIEIAPIFK